MLVWIRRDLLLSEMGRDRDKGKKEAALRQPLPS